MKDGLLQLLIPGLWLAVELFRYLNKKREEIKKMAGIKETKEVMVAANEMALFIVGRLKDGIGVDDAVAAYQKLTQDAEFKKIVMEAHDGMSTIGGEVKDLDIAEGLELAMLQLSYIPKYVDVVKK